MSVNGLVAIVPTSIASTGTGNSSSIGAYGKVTFSSCATISLNGVFTSTYDNYLVSVRSSNTDTAGTGMITRWRVGGTNATASNYVSQSLRANATTVSGTRGAAAGFADVAQVYGQKRQGMSLYVYGPFLTQSTVYRSVNVSDQTDAYISDWAGTHSLSTSYDGLTVEVQSGTFAGTITVYGFNQ